MAENFCFYYNKQLDCCEKFSDIKESFISPCVEGSCHHCINVPEGTHQLVNILSDGVDINSADSVLYCVDKALAIYEAGYREKGAFSKDLISAIFTDIFASLEDFSGRSFYNYNIKSGYDWALADIFTTLVKIRKKFEGEKE